MDGSFSVYDSTVICEYLEDRYPERALYPRDPRQRAMCRLIEDIADTQRDAALTRSAACLSRPPHLVTVKWRA